MDIQHITEQLDNLNTISSVLDVPENERSLMIQQMTDFTQSFIAGLPNIKGYRTKQTGDLSIHDTPQPLNKILEIYQNEVAETGINAAAGTHLGYIPGGGIFTSALADFIVDITNPYAGVHFASPGAATIENEVINWLKTIFSFPSDAVGNLTSGGSISMLIAFNAARDKYGIKNERILKSVIYASEQVHHSCQKALRILGLEDAIIRIIPMDEYHRMMTAPLAQQIEEDKNNGLIPFLVVATAGTTDTGAIDPLNEVADIAERHNVWLHIDAAYGGFFILTSRKELFKGIERADSIIVDPHKGMFLPYGLGAVLIKDRQAVLHSNQYAAHYMQDAEKESLFLSPSNLSPELTKHFRGLRMWLPLQIHGIEPFAACLEEKLVLVQYFRYILLQNGFQVGPAPDLSVSYFWYPFDSDCDEKNKALLQAIHSEGDVFLSSSIIDNRFVIRIAILAFRTKRFIIDRAMSMILRCLDKVK
ncbi:MAG: aminotransferase class V-fold PLP-dependent enzyme [Saprospiraceae bacterium]|nr:aminotransferase class V-fold PLP-dependent enzyme [Saprospiraceae bacterium]